MAPDVPPSRSGFFSRLRDGLRKTRDSLVGKIEAVFTGSVIDEAALDELEEVLLACDLGPAATRAVMDAARSAFRRQAATTLDAMRAVLTARVAELLTVPASDPPRPDDFTYEDMGQLVDDQRVELRIA